MNSPPAGRGSQEEVGFTQLGAYLMADPCTGRGEGLIRGGGCEKFGSVLPTIVEKIFLCASPTLLYLACVRWSKNVHSLGPFDVIGRAAADAKGSQFARLRIAFP